jgi:hypothetical protein
MKTASLLLLLSLLLLPGVLAVSCNYDKYPLIVSQSLPSALCTTNTTLVGCITWLSDPLNDSDVWGVLPEPYTLQGVGLIDYFQNQNHSVVVQFSTDRLLNNQTVTQTVVCGGEWVSFNVTPVFADYSEVVEVVKYGMDTSTAWIFGIVLLSAVIFIFLLLRGWSK